MKKRILLIDDEPTLGKVLHHYLSREYEVVLMSNGQEAMQWLQEGFNIDAIITDFEMPYMNGLDFIKYLRSSTLYKDIPLIVLSGIDDTSNKIACLEEGADDYMIKPFNPKELDLRVKNMLKRIKI